MALSLAQRDVEFWEVCAAAETLLKVLKVNVFIMEQIGPC